MTTYRVELGPKATIFGRSLNAETGPSGELRLRLDPPEMEFVNQCSHCHRGDWREVICGTYEQAAERHWLTILEATPSEVGE